MKLISRTQAKVHIALATLTRVIAIMPRSALLLIRLAVPLLPLAEAEDEDPAFEPPPELELPPMLAGEDGTKVATALERHELAAASDAETLEGADGLTVPLPAKLHARGSRSLSW